MDSDTRQQLILNTFSMCKYISNVQITTFNQATDIITVLQLYVDKNIVDQQDLYDFLMKKKAVQERNDGVLTKWFVGQTSSLITKEDIQYLINNGLSLDENSSLYDTYCDVVENISFDGISMYNANNMFGCEQFTAYLSSKPLSEIITGVKLNSEKKLILKEHILSIIDEINDIDDANIIKTCVDIIGMTDHVIEWFETAIQQNKYCILRMIMITICVPCMDTNVGLDTIHHIISIYERVTGDPFVINDDKYIIYFACFHSFGIYLCQSKYTTNFFRKIYQHIHFVTTAHFGTYPPSKELDLLNERYKQLKKVSSEMEKCKFSDLVLLEREVDAFSQWIQDVMAFCE